tara:strand:- start:839 stop:1051 length:213 start_codon:yes stop_codon:yes gene_type:complete
MTPKEKAKELVDKFLNIEGADDCGNSYSYVAKQCALIYVDEMIKNIIWSSDFNGFKRKELEEIKQEIQKL